MENVDSLLVHGTVVTMDADYRIIPDGAIAIRGDSIAAVGPSADILEAYSAEDVVNCEGHVIIPGLINAHTHVPMTLLRGLADDLRLDVWLMGYMMPTEQQFVNPEFVELGTRIACAEMIRSGVTTFNDMYYFEESVAKATAEVGMRAICGQTILKFPSPDSESYEAALERCRQFIANWHGHPLIIPAVAPHAPYTTTDQILSDCRDLALEFDIPLHIHIAETAQEVSDHREEYEMPVVPWVKKLGLFDAKVIAAHCVHLDRGEIHTLEHNGVGVSHNPSSNLKLASGIAPITDMLKIGVSVGIGTDGPASNNDLDMIEEARLAAFLAKVDTDDPTSLPARTALDMITRMGAKALHIDHLVGSLEPGKRADIAVIDMRRMHNWPVFSRDPNAVYSRIIYAAKSTDVVHVVCNGAWLMRDNILSTLDESILLEQATEVAQEIDTFLIAREGDILSKLLAIGGLEREESFEVQVKAHIDTREPLDRLLAHPDVVVVKQNHYKQYDTYFEFGPPNYERVRYREDDYIDAMGNVENIRTRLTLTSREKEREFPSAIILSRSRFYSPATRPLRFYREYFQAEVEREVSKERLRWHIRYRGKPMYVNLDRLMSPQRDGFFVEVKSRTWSLKDAEEKASMIAEMLAYIGIESDALLKQEYVTLASKLGASA
ncbi:MAG: amidohydrolase [Chloroflexi bacterium]|nr:amidohydrolase [Chloroflexota bacterium]